MARRGRNAGATAWGVALVLGLGCGVPRHHDEQYVAGELERRTGHGLPRAPGETAGMPPGVSLEDGLSDDEAVAIALWNNATFQTLVADLGFTRADLIKAGLLTNPVFSILFPLGPKQLEFALKLPIEALWLRPKRVAAARIDADRAADGLVQNGLELVRDVRVACANLRLAGRRADLADMAVHLAEGIAQDSEQRLQTGDASALEVTVPRVEVLLARDERARARQDLVLARAQLTALLGGTVDVTEITMRETAPPTAPVAHLVETALAGRPDMRAAELTVEAARERAGLSRYEVLAIAGIADAKGHETKGLLLGPGLETGIPIFNWNQGGTALADAELDKALRQERAVRQRIALEVTDAAARLETAAAQAAMWRGEVLPELEEASHRAERAYKAGDVPLLLVLQTNAQLVKSQVREAEAAAEIVRARAELERSLGSRLETP